MRTLAWLGLAFAAMRGGADDHGDDDFDSHSHVTCLANCADCHDWFATAGGCGPECTAEEQIFINTYLCSSSSYSSYSGAAPASAGERGRGSGLDGEGGRGSDLQSCGPRGSPDRTPRDRLARLTPERRP